jgi:hypothetical protein
MDTNEFIERANKIHNFKYVYSKSKECVVIICPKHGEFKQTPDSHLHNHGCKLCAIEEQHNKQRKQLDKFIEKAKIVHDNKYDYSKVEYINNHTDICIVCPIHGTFIQNAVSHLQGHGCQICNSSKLEVEMKEELENDNIGYISQCSYKELPWLNRQTLDFYIP